VTPAGAPERRIHRLLACYPRAWRDRYGDEFAQLLGDDLAEMPQSWRRTVNVAAAGLRARLAAAGLAAHPLDPAAAARAGVVTLAACLAAAGTFGAAMWSQLAIGLQWSMPPDHAITQALDLMSLALLMVAVLTVLAGVPLLASVIGAGRAAARPALLMLAGGLVLVIGGRHFENGWPGTGGHLLAQQAHVPSGIAAFCWAVTLWVSSYWAHPELLAAFPVGELIWMLACPVAIGALVTGALRLWQRVEHSRRALRYMAFLTRVGWASSFVFLAGAPRWVLAAGGGPGPLFHAGVIDTAILAVLGGALMVGAQAGRRAGLA
jgi:hypothetical protein